MIFYILLTIWILFLIFFYRFEGYLVLKNIIVSKYSRWKRLNQLVSKTEHNNVQIMWVSFKMVVYIMYISFLQYINSSVRKIDHKTYEVTYIINGRLYKMIVVPKRGPSPVLQISNNFQTDVTEQILPYMGPRYNWHGAKVNPKFFGYKALTFELGDGTEYTYEGESYVEL